MLFAFDVAFQIELLAIIDGIGKLRYPIAKDDDARLATEGKVEFYVAMAEDEVVNIGMLFEVLLGKKYQRFLVLALIRRVSPNAVLQGRLMLQSAVLCPSQAELHAEVGMQPTECPLAKLVMEDASDKPKLPVMVAKSVSMSKIEGLVAYIQSERVIVHRHATFLFQIVKTPDVMIAGKVMYLDAHVGQFAYLAEEACIAFWYDGLILKPEVEHVAEHVDGTRLVLYLVEEAHESPLLLSGVRNGKTSQMGIGYKVNGSQF